MRNTKRKYIAKKEDKENKAASVQRKKKDTRKLKKYRDRRIEPDGMKWEVNKKEIRSKKWVTLRRKILDRIRMGSSRGNESSH